MNDDVSHSVVSDLLGESDCTLMARHLQVHFVELGDVKSVPRHNKLFYRSARGYQKENDLAA